MARAQKLSTLDASFLHLETPATHMHIGGIAVFEPSPLGTGKKLFEALLKAISPRLDLMPRYRQKLAFVPLSLDVPVWVDDDDFDIRNHVLRSGLPAPGGDGELQDLAARVFSRQLDRRRPLWELYVVEGLHDGRWALLTKTHHAMVDGISNLELATILLDTDPRPGAPPIGVSHWVPSESPGGLGLLLGSLRERLGRPARMISAARAVAGKPRQLAAALRDTASGLAVMAQSVRTSNSAINGTTGSGRSYAFSRFPLEDFKAVKTTVGGTVNDAVLATVAGGLRAFLLARGEDPDDTGKEIHALCPVSIRDTSDRSALGNRLAMLLVKLPIDDADPEGRLRKVRQTVDRLKARKQAVGADFLLNLAGFAPATLHAMVARNSLKQLGFNLVVTNVPGPQFPLYCQGARLVEAFPIAFLYQGQHVAIAIFSYCGSLNFGYLADSHGLPDIDVFAHCIEESLAELVAAGRVDDLADLPAAAPRRRAGRHPRPARRPTTSAIPNAD
ncbi:MAG: WS/DGAT/MGAT family O-acyltransferase [Candidatus Dormibacteria bacterium]